MKRQQLRLTEINALDQAAFVTAFGFLFEGSPWIAAQTWPARPFPSVAALHAALCDVMHRAPVARQLTLIRAHPDLVGRAALAGTLTPESTGEQAAADLDNLAPDEVATFTRHNAAYHARFGFPFVICAREHKKDAILAGFGTRLQHSREQELETALGEIAKIAALRLRDVTLPDEWTSPTPSR